MQPSKVLHDISEPTTESIDAAKQAQARERAASGVNLDEEGRIKSNHSPTSVVATRPADSVMSPSVPNGGNSGHLHGESLAEQLARIREMADDDGDLWDLSRNDDVALDVS